MRSSLDNSFLFLVQVGKAPSLYSKRSNNICLLVLLCPNVVYENVWDCVFVIKLLLLGGDVELNPGPPDQEKIRLHNKIFTAILVILAKQDSRHAEGTGVLSE